MAVSVIILSEGGLERSDIEDGSRAIVVQPVPDVLKVLSEFLPVIDEVLSAIELYCLVDQQMRLIQNGAEVLVPVPLSEPQLYKGFLRVRQICLRSFEPAYDRHPDQRLVQPQLPRDPPQF
jgi:hypothetical protein